MADSPLADEVRALRNEVKRLRGMVLLGGFVALMAVAGPAVAERARKAFTVGNPDTGAELDITADGLVFRRNDKVVAEIGPDGYTITDGDKAKLSLVASESWSGLVVNGKEGTVAMSLGTDQSGSALRLFNSRSREIRAELTENLVDAGAGLRVYDTTGRPRATLYAERRGESGLEITDANRQPRIDLYAKPGGVSVIRASDSEAVNVAELSVLPLGDATIRRTGGLTDENDKRLVPMLYLLDNRGLSISQVPGQTR